MHENGHFLSYEKRRHDTENRAHMHTMSLGSRCKMASSHRVTDLEKTFQFESPRRKLRRHCQQLGLCLFPPCYFIFLEPCQVRGVSVFFVVFTLAFTTGQTSSGSLPFIGCFIFPVQPCLFHHNVTMRKVCSFQFNRLAISWPPWVRVWGWASYRFLPFTVFSLGLPFCFSSYIVHLRCTSEGVVSMFNETAHSFFVWGSS